MGWDSPSKEPMLWRVLEGIAVNLLIALTAVVALFTIVVECIKSLLQKET